MVGSTRTSDYDTELSPIKKRAARQQAADMEAALQQHYPEPDDLETPMAAPQRALQFTNKNKEVQPLNKTIPQTNKLIHDDLEDLHKEDAAKTANRRPTLQPDDSHDHRGPTPREDATNNKSLGGLSFLDDGDEDSIRPDFLLDEALAATELPAEYVSERNSINSIPDLVTHATQRFKDLQDAISDEQCGGELQEGIKKFILGFKSRKARRNDTIAAAGTIYHMDTVGSALRPIVRKGLKSGIGLSEEELNEMIRRSEEGQPVPQREIKRSDLQDINWTGILHLIMTMACRVTNFESRVTQTEERWKCLGIRNDDRVERALATELKWWDKCTHYLGYEITSVFKRMENLRGQIPGPVQSEFTRITTETKGKMKEMKGYREWQQFEEIFRDAWEAADGKGLLKNLREADGHESEGAMGEASCHIIARTGKPMTGEEVGEQILECKECEEKFTLTPADIARMRGKGQTRMPERCKACRDQGVDCKEMKEKGTCSYGEHCRFKHGEKRSKLCRAFSKVGRCRVGGNCEFAHVKQDDNDEEAQVYATLIDAHFKDHDDSDDTQSGRNGALHPVVWFIQNEGAADSDVEE